MAKGILYVTKTEIEGLIKIGRTQNLPKRKQELIEDGYKCQHCNVEFAIEVDDYEDKEKLLHSIFKKCRAGKTEFFAEDIELVIQTMSAFEGDIVYPNDGESKKDIFAKVTESLNVKDGIIPQGKYTLKTKIRGGNTSCSGTMIVDENNILTLKSGAILAPINNNSSMPWLKIRNELQTKDNVLVEDLVCTSPSMAASIVCGHNKNGWESWKNEKGELIDIYRQQHLKEDEE